MINKSDTKTKKTHKRGNGEGSITKRNDGRWVAKIQTGNNLDTGKPIIKSFYGKERKEVVAKLDDYKLMIKMDMNLSYHDTLLREYIINWLENVKIHRLKEPSYDTLYYTIKNNVIPYLGHYKLKDLNASIIQTQLINELLITPSPMDKDKTLSYSTIKKAYNALNATLEYARINRHIQFNPMDAVELPSVHKFEKTVIEIIDDDDVDKIINTTLLKFSNGKYVYTNGAGIILLLNTGIRIGELLGLQWKHIDLENNTLTVSQNVMKTTNSSKKGDKKGKSETILQSTPKTKSSNRIIPLNDNVIMALNILKENRYFGENSFIISTANNTVTSPYTFRDIYYRILNRAGVKKYSVHATRHTFASKLLREGADVKVISELLGHSNVSITYNTYIHIIEEQKIQGVKILDKLKWNNKK